MFHEPSSTKPRSVSQAKQHGRLVFSTSNARGTRVKRTERWGKHEGSWSVQRFTRGGGMREKGGRERREKRSRTQRQAKLSVTVVHVLAKLLWIPWPTGLVLYRWMQNGQDCTTRSICGWHGCGPLKSLVTTTLSIESISAVTLIRTVTAFYHSQKVE